MKTNEIRSNRLYDDLAYLWPLVSKPEDYTEKASYRRDILIDKPGDSKHHILELGVGGENNLSHLTAYFKAAAVDLSEEMLKNCIKQNPDVDVHIGHMRLVRLNKKFDAVIIHDAIRYLLNENDMPITFDRVSEHQTDLFPNAIWIKLIEQAGFKIEEREYP